MKHIVYETTCLVNNKIYIGKHSTENLDDGYLGSGVVLSKAIKKHGKEKFKRENLFVFDNEEEAMSKEAELVTLEFVLRDDTYNVAVGGGLGYTHTAEMRTRISKGLLGKKLSEDHKLSISKATVGKRKSEATKQKMRAAKEKFPMSAASRKRLSDAILGDKNPMFGKTHSTESNKKRSQKQQGRKRSDEHNDKLSGNNHPMFGKTQSNTTKSKISAANSKAFSLLTTDGERIEIVGLNEFCRNHGINDGVLRAKSKAGEFYKGYKILR